MALKFREEAYKIELNNDDLSRTLNRHGDLDEGKDVILPKIRRVMTEKQLV